MFGGKRFLATLLVVVVIVVAAYAYLSIANPRWFGNASRFVGSDRVKIDVTIGVVGVSTFIVGFGLRDVIGRWYQRVLRRKAVATSSQGHGR